MSQEHPTEYYRTTNSRVGKMLAIMLAICIVGGVIFFSMWDYWISEPPHVISVMAGDVDHSGPAEATGITITQDLQFLESADFRSLTFNAMIDEPGVNPTIEMSVGDKVVFNVVNDGMSFHAFGVTKDTEGFAGIIPGSEIAAPTNPMKPGESGTAEFIAGEEGTYYYICTVPGHRAQGMVGEIIVSGSSGPAVAADPTGVSH
ncbi:MAG: multicopper oxidase domain-containing protein, partial [Nitrosopumilaceae archaeon]|nr:multicopper oxidase domain-containing protein [Nitrosopumilaceae archaeon]